MIAGFLNFLAGGVFSVLNMILDFFPSMPIDLEDLDELFGTNVVVEILSWVNYFVPVSVCCGIVALWATGMMAYVGLKMAIKYSESLH